MIVFPILFFSLVIIVEIYAFYAFKTAFNNSTYNYIYVAINILIIIYVVYNFSKFDRGTGQNANTLFVIGILLITFIPKMVLSSFLFIEDISRVVRGIVNLFTKEVPSFLPERREFISKVALFTATIPFFSILYGVTKGKYNFKVLKQKIAFKNLPNAFDGFTITHISDIHSGSLDNAEKVTQAIEKINDLNSDILLFTGDIVNSYAREFDPWYEIFNKIKDPKYGKFSILGNHDYGRYTNLDNKGKEENFIAIKKIHEKIGFKLLLNENVTVTKDKESIKLLGVENWGRQFGEAGDLVKTLTDVGANEFKILMSHDPSHWDDQVQYYSVPIDLTLSGHTHGLQFGIEIPGYFKWSPVQYVYKQWAGLYENNNKYLYINRGFGFHGYPGRVGIMPEITQITLEKI